MLSDLHSISPDNKLFKFADDTYLLVPSVNSHTCESEIDHVNDWAVTNNLGLNQSKSLEMVITAPGIWGAKARTLPPPTLHAVERVSSLTMLGVTINDKLPADEHVADTIAACSKSLYALRVLRAHGMPTQALHSVYRATVLAKLLYCNQAWSGFCSAAARDRIDSFISRSKRNGYCADSVPQITELFADSDNSLLKRVLSNANRTLHEMLPPLNNKHNYNLRKRPHNHQLPIKGNSLQQSNFIVRALYAGVH